MATTAPAASVIPALTDRPVKNTICLFDVDGTLTPARRVSSALASALSSGYSCRARAGAGSAVSTAHQATTAVP